VGGDIREGGIGGEILDEKGEGEGRGGGGGGMLVCMSASECCSLCAYAHLCTHEAGLLIHVYTDMYLLLLKNQSAQRNKDSREASWTCTSPLQKQDPLVEDVGCV